MPLSPASLLSHKPSRFIVVLMIGLALLAPLPYVIIKPSTPENVLGKLITINGAESYPPSQGSKLFITAVLVTDPGTYVSGLQVLASWIDGTSAVFPRAEIYPPEQTDKEIKTENQIDMTNSQYDATAAALTFLKIKYSQSIQVTGTLAGSGAHHRLLPGDRIISVDGQIIGTPEQIRRIISSHTIGDSLEVTVQRKVNSVDTQLTEKITLMANQQRKPALGIFVGTTYEFPFTAKFNIQETGGPSGGMIFALGIIEKLTSEDLLRGRAIAGTGTIDDQGNVGPIGGINEKMIGAAEAGATIFLAPRANCVDIKSVPKKLVVIPVATLNEAVDVLRNTRPESLAGCR